MAMNIAQQLSHIKTFDTFFNRLVGAFGEFELDCAAYLWNKIHPEKPRKVIPDA